MGALEVLKAFIERFHLFRNVNTYPGLILYMAKYKYV